MYLGVLPSTHLLAKLLLIGIDVLPSGPFTVIDVNRGRGNGQWATPLTSMGGGPIDVNGTVLYTSMGGISDVY